MSFTRANLPVTGHNNRERQIHLRVHMKEKVIFPLGFPLRMYDLKYVQSVLAGAAQLQSSRNFQLLAAHLQDHP